MAKPKTLNEIGIRLVLDGRDKDLQVYLRGQRILIGTLCPYCGGRDLITNQQPGDRMSIHDVEAICAACSRPFSLPCLLSSRAWRVFSWM